MRRNWPAVNPTNNRFSIYLQHTQTIFEVTIPEGDYDSYSLLAAGINTGIANCINDNVSLAAEVSSIVVTPNAASRLLVFTITMAATATNSDSDVEIRCYHIKDGNVPTGVTKPGAYNDSYEIIGGDPLKTDEDKNSLRRDAADDAVLYSHFPASLSTLDAVYLRMNLELGNYESPGLDMFHRDGVQMQNSSIIARIPVRSSSSTTVRELHDLVVFEDSNDTYQKMLPLKNLEHLQFLVTDKRNRLLAQYDAGQAALGMMSFNLTLRWDKFVQPKQAETVPEGPPPQSYPPSYGYGKPRI